MRPRIALIAEQLATAIGPRVRGDPSRCSSMRRRELMLTGGVSTSILPVENDAAGWLRKLTRKAQLLAAPRRAPGDEDRRRRGARIEEALERSARDPNVALLLRHARRGRADARGRRALS